MGTIITHLNLSRNTLGREGAGEYDNIVRYWLSELTGILGPGYPHELHISITKVLGTDRGLLIMSCQALKYAVDDTLIRRDDVWDLMKGGHYRILLR